MRLIFPKPTKAGRSRKQWARGAEHQEDRSRRSLQRTLSQPADPGTVLPALGVPKLDLKEPSLIPDLQILCSGVGLSK